MRVYLTGGTGFVGGNIARVFEERHGAEVVLARHRRVDLTDPGAVRRSVRDVLPDAIVHAAILNDFGRLYTHRREGWDAYVGATRNLVDAANEAAARIVLLSTDWVFDGTQGGASEDTPPNPINLYGFLKAASELVVSERAEHGAVARVSGVNGVHWTQREAPRRQDAGFGYFVLALVGTLRAGRRFRVWHGPEVNTVATPTLASDAAGLLWRILSQAREGIFHCCGGETADRAELARRVVRRFDLDPDLLELGPPDPEELPPGPVPYDTSLSAGASASALGVELPDLDSLLGRMRRELDTGEIGPDPFAAETAALTAGRSSS